MDDKIKVERENLEELSKNYRNYRENCGIKDPVMLDEIESAYYSGMDKMREIIMKYLNNKIEE